MHFICFISFWCDFDKFLYSVLLVSLGIRLYTRFVLCRDETIKKKKPKPKKLQLFHSVLILTPFVFLINVPVPFLLLSPKPILSVESLEFLCLFKWLGVERIFFCLYASDP